MTIDEIKLALEGEGCGAILNQILDEISEMPCPSASGFEGPTTFPDCGECAVCLAAKVMGRWEP